MSNLKLDKSVITVSKDFEDPRETSYWHNQSPAKRLEHIARLREINYGDSATKRLQRILEVVKRT